MSDSEPELAPVPVPEPASPAPAPVPAPVPLPVQAPRPAPRKRPTVRVPKDLIPGYQLLEWLGEGTMGAVFRARQMSLDRVVAVKILTPRLASNEAYLRRFQREARSVAKLNHPNVVSGIDVGEVRGCQYFVMEYVSGATLADRLRRTGALEGAEATRIVLSVARALEHAHQAGLVHRDVKPANIIISHSGKVKLCDLGLAKEVEENGNSTSEGGTMGTPDYISPEQARGQADIDIRADIYSLGATFYHALTGRPPFSGPTPAVIMTKHLAEPLTPVQTLAENLPNGCATVLHRMMAKDRDDRHQDPTELIEDLQAVAEGSYREEPVIRRRRRTRRRFR